jgi:hypothetical protein
MHLAGAELHRFGIVTLDKGYNTNASYSNHIGSDQIIETWDEMYLSSLIGKTLTVNTTGGHMHHGKVITANVIAIDIQLNNGHAIILTQAITAFLFKDTEVQKDSK